MGGSLKDRIREESTDALKAGEKVRLSALRMLSAAIVNREKELRHELSDDEVRQVAARETKKRSESIEAFQAAGRLELVDRERAEQEVLAPFAPVRLDGSQVDALIDEAFEETGATGLQDMGKVMGLVMSRAAGGADGAEVQRKVRDRLGGGA